jgi:ribosomal protein L7Ae-like RNA K-turn-binding protein
VQAGKAALVLAASDGSEDERRRLLSGAENVSVAWPMDAAALGAVFGRDQAVHVAIAPGRLADGLMNEIERLSGVSGQVFLKQAGG